MARKTGAEGRLDLVHRLGRLALPLFGGSDTRHSPKGDRLFVKPVIPSHWDGYSATLRQEGKEYRIEVERAGKEIAVRVNGDAEEEIGAGWRL